MSNSVISMLRELNAKERFFLVGYALGNPDFKLGPDFRAALSTKIGQEVPEDAFCAMDYHLDWIHAALVAAAKGADIAHGNADQVIKAQQEDVDLLVAFERDGMTHLVLIEAKAATGWTNAQAKSKASRLAQIFGNDLDEKNGVRPYFVLMSPKESSGVNVTDWPKWTVDATQRPLWMELKIPERLRMVSRWNAVSNRADALGDHWKIVDR